MISNKRKPVKAITVSFSPLPHTTQRPKMEKWLFPHLCALMGLPRAFFLFFPAKCGGWSIGALFLSKKLRTPWFFYIIFLPFLPIFPIFAIFSHFGHFAHPHGSPLITSDPNSYFHVPRAQSVYGWHCLWILLMNFRMFLRNDHFSIFDHFDAWGPPYMAKPIQRGALGNTSKGPRQFLGPNHNPEKIASLIRRPTPVLGRYIIRKDLRKRQKKGKTLK